MSYSEAVQDRIRMAIVEEMQNTNIFKEPENAIPNFIEVLTNRLSEIVLDEIMYKKGRSL